MTHDQIKAPPPVAGVEGLLQPKAQFIGSLFRTFVHCFVCFAAGHSSTVTVHNYLCTITNPTPQGGAA